MTDTELIAHTVRITLEQLGYKPKAGRRYISQNQALKLLKPVRIGRNRLQRMILTGQVRMKDKENFDIRNSAVRLYAEDIYKLLNE